MQQTRIIYSLVSRGRETVLSSYTQYQGNFDLATIEVLKKCRLNQDVFDKANVMNYAFYTLAHEGFLFLVMVEQDYECRIAASFLKAIQKQFFSKFSQKERNQAHSHSLKQFNKILKKKAEQYRQKQDVDKLYKLKKQLSELQQISLQNLDKVIERGIKIQILVKKSQQLGQNSLDIKRSAGQINWRMKWKNRKLIIGIITAVVVVIGVVILVVLL